MPNETLRPQTFWDAITGGSLAQGDYLPNCPVPFFPPNYGQTEGDSVVGVTVRFTDLIVVTQSCDLENNKVSLVALCPIFTIGQLKDADAKYGKSDRLEEIRKGKFEALHMLSSPTDPTNNWDSRIVDFREIHSLPVEFLKNHATTFENRWRLKSPYLEHFSQGFARFFMRVGLPSAIQKFK
jgi:hypothetical protein